MAIQPPSVLVYGDLKTSAFPAIRLFQRAGYQIDVISGTRRNHIPSAVRSFHLKSSLDEILECAQLLASSEEYLFTVPLDDACLKRVKECGLALADKLSLLPVTGADYLDHIASKCALSQRFSQYSIPTPNYGIASSQNELYRDAERLGFPILVKTDFSWSGQGVFFCHDEQDLEWTAKALKDYPVLCQNFLTGQTISVEAIFAQGNLLDFNYSTVIKNVSETKFGVSSARAYIPRSHLPRQTENLIWKIGESLGAHGILSIGGIQESTSGQLFFFEADARANGWVAHSIDFEDGLSRSLQQYGWREEGVQGDVSARAFSAGGVSLSISRRLSAIDFFLNRYSAWRCLIYEPNPKGFILKRLRRELFALLNFKAIRRLLKRPSRRIRKIRGL